MNPKSQVTYYTTGTAEVDIHFPEDDTRCVWCPFCRDEQSLRRYWCRLTNRVVTNPDAFGLPMFCPIKFNEEVKENET